MNEHEDCCNTGVKVDTKVAAQCPACRTKGKAVKPITIESLVVDEARQRVGRADGFRFCAEPACAVAYFHPETGARIEKDEVRVRIGQKETGAPRPVCYCFEHTVEEIEAEVRATGTSKVAGEITAKCKDGLDRCAETNPQGSCCLGNVRQAMKQAQQPDGSRTTGLLATGGAVVLAILASACCWLPLLLIGVGASAAGLSGFFEAYRPYLLGGTGLLLAGAFYVVYFRKKACVPGSACAAPNPRLQHLNKVMLWVATVVVLAFALFPNYLGYLLDRGQPRVQAPASGISRQFRIEGMTCEGCAVMLRQQLGGVPGVARADVSYEKKTARVFFAAKQAAPSEKALLAAINKAGYSGTPDVRDASPAGK